MKINSLLIKSFLWMLQGCPLHIGPITAAAIGAGVAVAGAGVAAGVQSSAAGKAAGAAQTASLQNQALLGNANERARALQDKAFIDAQGYITSGAGQARADINPWASSGLGALQKINAGMQGAMPAQPARAASGTTPQQLADITGQFNSSAAAITQAEQRLNQLKQQGAGATSSGNIYAIYALQQAGNEAQRALDAAKAAHQNNVAALERARANPYQAATEATAATTGQESTFNRDFNAQDYSADPTTGGQAPPVLAQNFDEAAWRQSQGIGPKALTKNFDEAAWRNSQGIGAKGLTRAFTNADFIKDPGYDFRMAEGNRSIESSAASRGGQLSGATMKALAKYGQGFASNEFGAASNRWTQNQQTRQNERNTAYDIFGKNQQNRQSERNTAYDIYGKNRDNASQVYGNAFNRWEAQQGNKFNRLNSLAGSGQNAATNQAGYISGLGTNLSNLATGYATNVGNMDLVAAGANVVQNNNAALARQNATLMQGQALGAGVSSIGNSINAGIYDYYNGGYGGRGGGGGGNNLTSPWGADTPGNKGFNSLNKRDFWS